MYKDNQDRIDAYLRGKMSVQERRQFVSDLATDSKLYDEYIATKAIADAIADRQEKLYKMALWNEQEELQAKLLHKKRVTRNWTIGISAAACIAVGFFTYTNTHFSTSINNVSAVPDFRSEEYYRTGNGAFANLDSLIDMGEFERALAYSDSIIQRRHADISRLGAKARLSEVDSDDIDVYKAEIEDADWRYANLLIATNRTEEAKKYLKKMVKKGGIYAQRADSLLKVLNRK